MRAVVQRVRRDQVRVGDEVAGHYGSGYVRAAVGNDDSFADADYLAGRLPASVFLKMSRER